MTKIQMTTPLVEMDGDEMTRIIWQEFCQGGTQHIPCGTHAAV